MTRPGQEPVNYHMRGWHANHWANQTWLINYHFTSNLCGKKDVRTIRYQQPNMGGTSNDQIL